MRAIALAIVALVILAGCEEPPVRQVTATFVPGAGDTSSSTLTAPAILDPAFPVSHCDLQNSVQQDSGLPVLLIRPASPRRGEVVTVTGTRLVPGPHRLILMASLERDRELSVSVDRDGRLDATFPMPDVTPGRCAMLLLGDTGIQSLGFVVGD